jgi:hypothetical protein
VNPQIVGSGLTSDVYIQNGSQSAVKVRKLQETASSQADYMYRVKKSADYMVRDLTVYNVMVEYADRATLDGKKFIEVAPILSGTAEHGKGIIVQKAVPGYSVFEIQEAIDVLVGYLKPGAKLGKRTLYTEKEAAEILGSIGMGAAQDVELMRANLPRLQREIRALERFYMESHLDLEKVHELNELKTLASWDTNGRAMKIGFDFNHGRNVKVVLTPEGRRKFVVFDQ